MDQDEAFDRVWQTFRSFDRLADGRHDTIDWRSRLGVFAVCVVRVPAAALQPALDACRDALEPYPFVRLHPDRFLHVSLQELGFVCTEPAAADETSPARLEEFVSSVSGPISEQRAFEMSLGGINSFQDAVFLEVHDGGRCARLHRRLFELAAIPRSPRFAYLPHVTIAHYLGEAPLAGLAATLVPWRDRSFGRVRVSEVEVVTLRVDEPYPPLEPYAVFPLAAGDEPV